MNTIASVIVILLGWLVFAIIMAGIIHPISDADLRSGCEQRGGIVQIENQQSNFNNNYRYIVVCKDGYVRGIR